MMPTIPCIEHAAGPPIESAMRRGVGRGRLSTKETKSGIFVTKDAGVFVFVIFRSYSTGNVTRDAAREAGIGRSTGSCF